MPSSATCALLGSRRSRRSRRSRGLLQARLEVDVVRGPRSSADSGGRAERRPLPVADTAQSSDPPKAPDGTRSGPCRRPPPPEAPRAAPTAATATATLLLLAVTGRKKGWFILASSQRSHSRIGSRLKTTALRPPSCPLASFRASSRALVAAMASSPRAAAAAASASTYTLADTTRPPAPCAHVRSPTSRNSLRCVGAPGPRAGASHTADVPFSPRLDRKATYSPHGEKTGLLASDARRVRWECATSSSSLAASALAMSIK